MFSLKKKNFRKIDILLVLSVFILCAFGLIVLYSATKSLENRQTISQLVATLIGICLIAMFTLMDVDFLRQLTLPIYTICIGLLVLTLFIGVGTEQWGAQSWIRLGFISFQPSEFVKVGLIVCLADMIDRHQREINRPQTLLKLLAYAFLPVGLILLQPDAGTAMVFIFFIVLMFFSAGISWRYIAGALTAGVLSLPIIYSQLSQFQKDRILNFFNPARDVDDSNYQAIQGKIAIGSGKLTGRGYLQGTQTQYNFIPEKQTDFIYAVVVEELGFIGGLAVILLYFVLLYRILVVAKNHRSVFGSTVCVGVAAMLLFHIFENIGMTIGLMPITGIPLPFFSYGGTFQLVNLIAIGLILCVTTQKDSLEFDSSRFRRY